MKRLEMHAFLARGDTVRGIQQSYAHMHMFVQRGQARAVLKLAEGSYTPSEEAEFFLPSTDKHRTTFDKKGEVSGFSALLPKSQG